MNRKQGMKYRVQTDKVERETLVRNSTTLPLEPGNRQDVSCKPASGKCDSCTPWTNRSLDCGKRDVSNEQSSGKPEVLRVCVRDRGLESW